MGVPTRAEVFDLDPSVVAFHREILDITPEDDEPFQASIVLEQREDIWSCPKDEQVPVVQSLQATPTATPASSPLVERVHPTRSAAPFRASSKEHSERTVEQLRIENEELRTALEKKRLERRCHEEDGWRVQGRLNQLENEVRGHWQERVAHLEAEVAQLKGSLVDVTATNRAALASIPSFGEPEEESPPPGLLQASLPSLPISSRSADFPEPWDPLGSSEHAMSSNSLGLGGLDRKSTANLPWWASAVDQRLTSMPRPDEPSEPPRTPVAMLPRGYTSPHPPTPPGSSSPLARRLPAARATLASDASRQSDGPWHAMQQGSPGPGFYSNLPNTFIRSPRAAGMAAGVTAPRTFSAKIRSRSLPSTPIVSEETDSASVAGFLEAFGGFYKQLVQGPQCTGPDALAINESSHEVDLSAEFPPERREAQVDLLNLHASPQQQCSFASQAWRENDRDREFQTRLSGIQSMHHL